VDAQRLKTPHVESAAPACRLTAAGSAFLQPLRAFGIRERHQASQRDPGGTCEFDLPD